MLRVTTGWVYAQTRADGCRACGSAATTATASRRSRRGSRRSSADEAKGHRSRLREARRLVRPLALGGRGRLNRRIGPVRSRWRDGLTRGEAERAFARCRREDGNPTPAWTAVTVDDACSALRRKLEYVGVSRSYAANCERKQRLHIGPAIGDKVLQKVTRRDVERLGEALIAKGLSPKTVRNTLTFLHGVFEHAIDLEWTRDNPVRRAARPRRRRQRVARPGNRRLGRSTAG